jgi:two-component system sensor histidine kinase KdpD
VREPADHTARPPIARAAVIAVLFTAVATLVSLPFSERVSVASFYLLAVVASAAIGGLYSGLAAALLSFLGLNFFFTPPRHTFRVQRPEDLVSLVVFLVVATIVGTLLARALQDRARAARKEQETRLLSYLSTKLISGEPIERLLDDFAATLLEPFDLLRCEVSAVIDDHEIHAGASVSSEGEPGPSEIVPIVIGSVPLGTLSAVRRHGGHGFSSGDRALLEAAAKQVALAIERTRLDVGIQGARLEAETNQLRAALFSSVTHDLRTPLASIKAAVTSLLSDTAVHDDAQQRELLTTVLEETDRLNRVVGNLMDLAKIRAGALEPAREPSALDELVQAVVARMRSQLAAVQVRLNLRPDLPDVFVDPVQIDQVLTNLIENAALHSPIGGEVTISAAPFRDVIQVRVVDRGPGIAMDERERVFEAFYRGDAAPERPGSGLGLAIARAIVVGHGGKIWIEGAPGGGTAVVFELPVWEEAR